MHLVRHAERSPMFESFDLIILQQNLQECLAIHKVGNVQDKIVQTGWLHGVYERNT